MIIDIFIRESGNIFVLLFCEENDKMRTNWVPEDLIAFAEFCNYGKNCGIEI